MKPGQLGSRLLPKLTMRAMFGKKRHVFEIAAGKAAHFRKALFQIGCQTVDHLGPPALFALPLHYLMPDAAIQLHQLGINDQHGSRSGLGYLGFQPAQPVCVACGDKRCGTHRMDASSQPRASCSS